MSLDHDIYRSKEIASLSQAWSRHNGETLAGTELGTWLAGHWQMILNDLPEFLQPPGRLIGKGGDRPDMNDTHTISLNPAVELMATDTHAYNQRGYRFSHGLCMLCHNLVFFLYLFLTLFRGSSEMSKPLLTGTAYLDPTNQNNKEKTETGTITQT